MRDFFSGMSVFCEMPNTHRSDRSMNSDLTELTFFFSQTPPAMMASLYSVARLAGKRSVNERWEVGDRKFLLSNSSQLNSRTLYCYYTISHMYTLELNSIHAQSAVRSSHGENGRRGFPAELVSLSPLLPCSSIQPIVLNLSYYVNFVLQGKSLKQCNVLN